MTDDTSKTLTLKPSTQLQEKLQQIKNLYDKGASPKAPRPRRA